MVVYDTLCLEGKRHVKIHNKKDTPEDIWIPDENCVKQQIDLHKMSVGQKTLGTYLAPDGNNNDQFQEMEEATNKWATKIQRSYMAKFSVDVSVQSTIMKNLAYPTATISITERECNKLMTKIKTAALPKMRISRTIGHAYLYGLTKFQGFSFPHLYTEICVERLKMFLNTEDGIQKLELLCVRASKATN